MAEHVNEMIFNGRCGHHGGHQLEVKKGYTNVSMGSRTLFVLIDLHGQMSSKFMGQFIPSLSGGFNIFNEFWSQSEYTEVLHKPLAFAKLNEEGSTVSGAMSCCWNGPQHMINVHASTFTIIKELNGATRAFCMKNNLCEAHINIAIIATLGHKVMPGNNAVLGFLVRLDDGSASSSDGLFHGTKMPMQIQFELFWTHHQLVDSSKLQSSRESSDGPVKSFGSSLCPGVVSWVNLGKQLCQKALQTRH